LRGESGKPAVPRSAHAQTQCALQQKVLPPPRDVA
jgi:hypothetical protein